MPWNILVLPLLGGFLFVEYFLPTRIAVRRHHPQRLILHSAHVVVWLLLCSTLLLHLSSHLFSDEYELARQTMQSITTIPHLGKSIGALLIGFLLPRISNWFYGKYCSLRDGRHSTSIRIWRCRAPTDHLDDAGDRKSGERYSAGESGGVEENRGIISGAGAGTDPCRGRVDADCHPAEGNRFGTSI